MGRCRAVGEGSGQARVNLFPFCQFYVLPSHIQVAPPLSSLFLHLLFSNHGHFTYFYPQYVFPTSTLTMAISTASIVCCLRSSNHIPSSHLYKLTNRECSRDPPCSQNSWMTDDILTRPCLSFSPCIKTCALRGRDISISRGRVQYVVLTSTRSLALIEFNWLKKTHRIVKASHTRP